MKQVSLFYGDEDFLIDSEVKKVIDNVLPGADKSLNLDLLEGETATITNIINCSQALGMFQTDKVVVVKNFSLLKQAKAAESNDKKAEFENDNLKKCLEGLSQGTYVIFVYYGKVDSRKKFTKYLKKIATVKEFKTYASYESDKVISWIQEWVKAEGKSIDITAADKLHAIAGENLRVLDNEIKKLITYIGSNDSITVADVETMVSAVGSNAFELLDSLVDGNSSRAFDLLNKIFYFGEQPIKLLALFVSHFRGLLMIRSLMDDRMNNNEIAKHCGKHPFIVQKTMQKIRRINTSSFIQIIDKLAFTDLNMKTGKVKPVLAMEMLCSDILELTKK